MTPTLGTQSPDVARPDVRTTRVGAALGITSIVLMMTGLVVEAPADAVHTNPAEQVLGYYTGGDVGRKFAGGLTVALGMMLFLPFVATLTSRLPDARGALLAPTAQMAAAVYVAISLAPGQAAGAAALWLGRSGDADTAVLALNDLRAFSFYLSLVALAVVLVAVGAATTGGGLPRWASWSAIGIGVAVAAGVPLADTGLAELASLVGFAWVIAVSVQLLRRPTTGTPAGHPDAAG